MNSPTQRNASASARAAWANKGALPRSVVLRAAWFLVLWLVLIGADPADLPAGALSAALATWVSLLLLPPGRAVRSPAGMARLALRFLLQSVIGGVDVNADRMMAAQLIGTGGIATLLLLGAVTEVPAAVDVALTLALLATFASIAFVKKGSARVESSA